MAHKNSDNYRYSDKRRIECLDEKVKDYEDGWEEIDAMIIADIESYYDYFGKTIRRHEDEDNELFRGD